jgi:hypothetical protein
MSTVTGDVWIVFSRQLQELIDAADKPRPHKGYDIPMGIMIRCNRVGEFQAILDEMFMQCMDGVKGWFLTRDPDIITMPFSGLRPW